MCPLPGERPWRPEGRREVAALPMRGDVRGQADERREAPGPPAALRPAGEERSPGPPAPVPARAVAAMCPLPGGWMAPGRPARLLADAGSAPRRAHGQAARLPPWFLGERS